MNEVFLFFLKAFTATKYREIIQMTLQQKG